MKRVEAGDAERRRAVTPVIGGRPAGQGRNRQRTTEQRENGPGRGGVPETSIMRGQSTVLAGEGATPAPPGIRSRSTRGSDPDHPAADLQNLSASSRRISVSIRQGPQGILG